MDNNRNLDALRQFVLDDPTTQSRLFKLEDRKEFITAIQQLAASRGLPLEQADIQQVMHAAHSSWIKRNRHDE